MDGWPNGRGVSISVSRVRVPLSVAILGEQCFRSIDRLLRSLLHSELQRSPHLCKPSSVVDRKMKVVAAYLLALLGGNPSPSAKDLTAILSSVGAEADQDKISFLLKELEGKDILEVIASGREKFASVPSGGGGGVVVAGGGGAASAPKAEEAKVEEKKEEPKEESDDDMGFSLFD